MQTSFENSITSARGSKFKEHIPVSQAKLMCNSQSFDRFLIAYIKSNFISVCYIKWFLTLLK